MNRIHILLRSIGFLVGAALLSMVGSALAQTGQDDLPPHVIDVWPYPGEEVPPGEAVIITFDQAMDAASVEAAWQIEPPVSGSFNWLDEHTVAFLPEGGWERATRYQVTLGTGAQAANGLALEQPYDFHIQTVGYLEVATVIPAPDAEGVDADATIAVSFNRPVVPLVSTEQLADLPSPLSFEPEIEGSGEWVNTSLYVFTPDKPLNGGTTFTARVAAGLTDVTGSTLREDYAWQFRTLPPQVLNVQPYQGATGIPLEARPSVEFSQPMDRPSTEEAFLLIHNGERVPGSFEWSEDSRLLTFVPDGPLEIESMYSLSVAPGARSASGEATLDTGITYTFQTVPYPGIETTYPRNGEQGVQPGSGLSITFKSPMNTATFEDKVQFVSPEQVEWKPVVQGPQGLYLDFASQPETTYIITFRAGAEDVYGNPIQTDHTFTFTTGKVEPWATLPLPERFALTSAYRDDTRIVMGVQGKPTVDFRLYRVETEQIGLAMRAYYDEKETRLTRPENLVREWSQQLEPGPSQYGVDDVLLASDEGGKLPPGVYYLQARAPNNRRYPEVAGLGVVTANLTVKRGPGEMLVWVTDLQSAEPVVGTSVRLYNIEGRLIASGETNEEGIFRTAVQTDSPDDFVYAIAEGTDVYGVWHSWSEADLPDTAGYLYTDRPIYRPGQKVYFRGAVRDRQDMNYSLPEGETVYVTIDVNWGSLRLFEGELPLSEFGTFDGEIELPEDIELGNASIVARYRHDYDASVNFTIAEFRTPEYRVDVTPDNLSIVQGDPLRAIVGASYYFGGPVSDADLTWNAIGQTAYFQYTGPGRYTFTDSEQEYFSWVQIGSGSEPTDTSGQVLINLEDTDAPSIRPMTISLEAEVVDESGQYISGRTSVLAHPANVYVGLRSERYFGRENTPFAIDLIAVTPESEPIAGQEIDLTLVEIRWERMPVEGEFGQYRWERREIEVETGDVTTGSDGTAHYSFTPPQAGIYQVRAQVRDARERINRSSLRFWVTGNRPVWWGEPSDTIDLIADKEAYQPGDTAQILVPVPFSGESYALVTVERAGVQQYEVVRVEGSTLLYDLPITEAHVPTVYFTVTLVKGVDEESANPSYRVGTIQLPVTPVNQRLNVTVTPSEMLAQPGDTLTLDVKTTDARGEPVSAEVGVTLTDLAILSLLPPNSIPLEEAFYGRQSNYVYTGVALDALLDTMSDELLQQKERLQAAAAPGAAPMPTMTAGFAMDTAVEESAMADGAAQNAAPEVTIRQDFQQTPLWAPRVVTDASGQATISVTLPDNLTTWHLDARGLTAETQVGDAALDVMSTLPLLVRPVAPRFFVEGDRVRLASVINNNTGAVQTVEAILQATGVTFESDETQSVTIPAGQRARVEWMVTVEDVPFVDLTFIAIGADGYQDATKPTLATGPDGTIPVYRYTAPDTVGTGGVLREEGARTEAISLPPRLDADQGELTIQVDHSLAATTIDALDYLRNFEHQCIEQTVSRFLPNIMTYRALKDLGLDDPELEAKLRDALDFALNKLANEQNPDGGWGWFGGMESNSYVTAYAALGLIEARSAGFDLDTAMVDRALNYVRGAFVRPGIDTPVWELNRQAFYSYVLARGGWDVRPELDALHQQRLEMDYWARAFMLMAYHELDPGSAQIADLVSDLQTGAILSATGAHWEEDEIDWWNWNSDTRTTALALAALTRVQPQSDLLPNVVRWLMVARRGDHWETTQETAWAVMGLTDWMVASGELRGSYDYAVTLNGDVQVEGTVTPDTVREGQTLRVQVRDLLRDEANRLILIRGEGEGVLYYSAHLKLRLWASEAKPISRGVSVSREYFVEDKPGEPVTSAQVGDVITVRVTLTLPQSIYYFVLEDPIPAGTEPVDTSLLTTSQLNEPPALYPDDEPYYWFWGWWYWDHTEMRDEKVNLYADFLPGGTYTYTYQVRATVPGEFQTMPSHAYAFYFPEVFGRGAGTLFTIEPESGPEQVE
ncbi:MAG: hypothetical protein GXY36_15210 [Chloroflexi bacterium]|nr:hypothetical protein [Chloroflexota bacterium]